MKIMEGTDAVGCQVCNSVIAETSDDVLVFYMLKAEAHQVLLSAFIVC